MLVDTLKLLEMEMANPLSRAIVRAGTKRNAQGKSRLELALAAFSQKKRADTLADWLYVWLIGVLLSAGCKAFGANVNALREYLGDPIVRRGVASVLSGIASYGITKPQLLKAPFLVVWNLTNVCNLKCKHCCQRAGVPSPDELTLEEKLKIVNELADAGVVSIAFSGGEPLIDPDFFLVINEVRRREMHAAVATNGTLITKALARSLKEADIGYVEVSLDFIRPKVNDEFRGILGAWQRAVEGIMNSVGEGLYTAMATTVTKLNLRDVADLIDLAKNIGVSRFIHFNFIPTGRGKEIANLDLSPLEREGLLKLLYEKSRTAGIEVLSTAPQYARVVLQESEGYAVAPTHFYVGSGHKWGIQTLAEFIGGCGSGRLYCAVEPNGDVTPCVFIPQFVVGNLREHRFLEIWNQNRIFSAFRKREELRGTCSDCKFKCVCGGCRARSLGYFEDFNAPDVGCIYNQKSWDQLLENFMRPERTRELAFEPTIRSRSSS